MVLSICRNWSIQFISIYQILIYQVILINFSRILLQRYIISFLKFAWNQIFYLLKFEGKTRRQNCLTEVVMLIEVLVEEDKSTEGVLLIKTELSFICSEMVLNLFTSFWNSFSSFWFSFFSFEIYALDTWELEEGLSTLDLIYTSPC